MVTHGDSTRGGLASFNGMASGEDWRIAPHFAMCVKSVLKMGWTCHLATCEKNQQLLRMSWDEMLGIFYKGASWSSWSSWYATAPRQWKSSLGCSATSSRHSSSPALSIPAPINPGAGAPCLCRGDRRWRDRWRGRQTPGAPSPSYPDPNPNIPTQLSNPHHPHLKIPKSHYHPTIPTIP